MSIMISNQFTFLFRGQLKTAVGNGIFMLCWGGLGGFLIVVMGAVSLTHFPFPFSILWIRYVEKKDTS